MRCVYVHTYIYTHAASGSAEPLKISTGLHETKNCPAFERQTPAARPSPTRRTTGGLSSTIVVKNGLSRGCCPILKVWNALVGAGPVISFKKSKCRDQNWHLRLMRVTLDLLSLLHLLDHTCTT